LPAVTANDVAPMARLPSPAMMTGALAECTLVAGAMVKVRCCGR